MEEWTIPMVDEILIWTNPRVYALEPDLILVVDEENRLAYNTKTMKTRSAPEQPLPNQAPIYQFSGNVIIEREFSVLLVGFRIFDPVYHLDRVTFFREDFDPLRQLRKIWEAVTDMDSSDSFEWIDGHYVLGGDSLVEAVEILLCLLTSHDREASILSARTIQVLFRHSNHRCYNQTVIALLHGAGKELRRAVSGEQDPEVLSEMQKALEAYETSALTSKRNLKPEKVKRIRSRRKAGLP
jgi:hypothetical protein